MSPELFDPEIQAHQRVEYSDRYALGAVTYEVLSRCIPFYRSMNFVVSGKLLKGERPERPQGPEEVAWSIDDVWEVLKLCWASLPQDRPGIEDMLRCLDTAAISWTPPLLSMAVPPAVNPPTSNTFDITSEHHMDTNEVEVPWPSEPFPRREFPYYDRLAVPGTVERV